MPNRGSSSETCLPTIESHTKIGDKTILKELPPIGHNAESTAAQQSGVRPIATRNVNK